MNRQALKPGAWGVVAGSIITMVIGFGWGGWTTSSSAERMAAQRASTAVTAALVPVCLEKSTTDPGGPKKLVALKALPSSWDQGEAVLKGGWATVGAGEANRDVADACAAALLAAGTK